MGIIHLYHLYLRQKLFRISDWDDLELIQILAIMNQSLGTNHVPLCRGVICWTS